MIHNGTAALRPCDAGGGGGESKPKEACACFAGYSLRKKARLSLSTAC